eukprot:TRINITY_DN1619_c0_g1_i2.p1 TRINITY_DN1619_c0_g1~~TRINITY_DN1619_c0_g1_i2.p1  ORF type:complete len:138 (+),score=22.07 TRINITY_DN1619_c0_g1_i2:284-697(+)
MNYISDAQKIGTILTGFGVLFTVLGVMLFFDRGFLAIGNISFLVGVTLIIGHRKLKKFFFQRKKIKGTICFLGGILLVLLGWTFIGLFIEIFGFVNLFGDFFPVIFSFLSTLPIIGNILQLPYIRNFVEQTSARLPV